MLYSRKQVGHFISVFSILGLVIGAGVTYLLLPPKIQIETQIVEKDKIIVQERVVTRRQVDVKKPDGTTVTSVTEKVEDKATDQEVDRRIAEKVTLRPERKQPQFGLSALAQTSLYRPGQLSYGVMFQYRLAGPVWLQAGGTSDMTAFVGIGILW